MASNIKARRISKLFATQYFLRINALDTHWSKRRAKVRKIDASDHYDHDSDRKQHQQSLLTGFRSRIILNTRCIMNIRQWVQTNMIPAPMFFHGSRIKMSRKILKQPFSVLWII